MKFLFSKKHSKGKPCAIWWGSNSMGYTEDLSIAGEYSDEEAANIEKETLGDAIAIDITELDNFPIRYYTGDIFSVLTKKGYKL